MQEKQLLVSNMLKDSDYMEGGGARSSWYSVCEHMKECVYKIYANNMMGLRARLMLEVKDPVLFTVTSLIINTVAST